MNFKRILFVSFLVLVISTYQTDSGIIISLLLKVLLLKGALFMSMPLTIGAFMMGQGMGFFAGNMMGGYMMLRAANRYHNTEKTRWMGYGDDHGHGYKHPGLGHGWGDDSHKYQHAYDKGKHIGSAIVALKAHKLKLASAVAHIKGALHKGLSHGIKNPGWSSGHHSSGYGPSAYYTKGPVYKGPVYKSPVYKSKGWGWGSSSSSSGGYGSPYTKAHDHYHTAHSKSQPIISDSDTNYKLIPYENYKHFAAAKGAGYNLGASPDVYKSEVGEILKGQVDYQNHYPPGSLGSDSVQSQDPSDTYYTSAYGGPGHEYTGILTHNLQDEAQDKSSEMHVNLQPKSSSSEQSSTVAPNPVFEKYLEKRLEEEADKQKDEEQKQEAQQLIQMLRKAYLKQLVTSLKEEERLGSGSKESSEFPRGSRSIEHAEKNNIIRDLLFRNLSPMDTSTEMDASSTETINKFMSQSPPAPITSTEKLQTTTSTEKVTPVTSTEKLTTSTERLTSTNSPITSSSENYISSSENSVPTSTSTEYYVSSTENPMSSSSEAPPTQTEKPVQVQEDPVTQEPREFPEFAMEMPAMWIKAENTFSNEAKPFMIRVKRDTGNPPIHETEDDVYDDTPGHEESSGQTSPQPAMNAETEKQISAFVDDIKKFFTLLTVLDQDQCLQKLVCDVHTNQKDLSTITQYEQNILTTFKLMKALMPPGEEDSSSKYRRAALIGETGQSLELCQQTYSPCGFSSSQIITLGTQTEATPTDWQGAGTQQQASARSDYVTFMPRVRRTLRSYHNL